MRRTRKKEEPAAPYRSCDAEGCMLHAEFRAPKERKSNTDYHWFCLDHVRDYNKHWDYFEGMDTDAIEHFRKEAVTGHRPTWMLGAGALGSEKLRAAFDRFMEPDASHEKISAPPINAKDRKALKALELEHPSDRTAIKRQFKKLAKSLHPDVNPGDTAAEDRFKQVTEAYHTLMAGYAESIGDARRTG